MSTGFARTAYPQQSNLAGFGFTYELRSEDDDVLFPWSGWTATVTLSPADHPQSSALQYTSGSAQVTLPSDGVLVCAIGAAAMADLCGQYVIGLRLSNGTDADTVQVFIGTVPVVEGV